MVSRVATVVVEVVTNSERARHYIIVRRSGVENLFDSPGRGGSGVRFALAIQGAGPGRGLGQFASRRVVAR